MGPHYHGILVGFGLDASLDIDTEALSPQGETIRYQLADGLAS